MGRNVRVIFRRALLWLVAVAAVASFAARRAGVLAPRRDPDWYAIHGDSRVEGRLVGCVRRTRAGWRTLLEFPSASGPQRAQLWLPKGADPAAFEPGRALCAFGRLRLPRRPRDPGDDDEEARASAVGAAWVLRVERVKLSSAPASAAWRVLDWAQRARLSAEASFRRRLEPRRAALLSAIVLGDSGSMSLSLSRAVRDSGGTHLLVVSGLKVGFAAAAVALAGLALGLRPGPRALVAVGAAGFYALMAGADPPSVRAWLMLAAAAAARALDRPTTPSAALTFAAAALLAASPAAALSTGAVMSVGGTAAVLSVARRLDASAPRSWPRPARAARTLLGINVAIAVALWPLFAGTFGRGSLIGPLANLALVPVAAGLMGLGAALWAMDLCLPSAAPLASWATDFGLGLFERICARAAALPWAAIELRPWRAYEIAAYALFLGALLAWPRRRLSAGFAAGALGLWGGTSFFYPPSPVSVVLLSRTPGGALIRFSGGRALYVGPHPPGAGVRRAALALGAAPIERSCVGRRLRFRLGIVEFLAEGARGPFVRRGEGPFAMIGDPRAGALEASTDGDFVLVQKLFSARVRRGPDLPQ